MSKPIAKESYVKFQSKKIGAWKKRWLVLRTINERDRCDVVLEKYVDETAALMGQVKRIIPIRRTINISRDPEKKHAIHIILEGTLESIKFALESEADAISWLNAINNECASPNSGSKDKFQMHALRNSKLPINGECTLLTSPTHLTVLNPRQQEVVQWPLNKLRRYAVERGIFSVEAGRSTSTGEGTFLFEGEDAEAVYQRVNFLVKSKAPGESPRLMIDELPPSYNEINNINDARQQQHFNNFNLPASRVDSYSSFNSDPYQSGDLISQGSFDSVTEYNGSQYGGSQHGASRNGGSQYGGSQHGASRNGGSQYAGSQYGGTKYGGSQNSGSSASYKPGYYASGRSDLS